MKYQCDREDCFAWTTPKRYKNSCDALEEVDEFYCPFYKTKEQAREERKAMKRRARYDLAYRSRLEGYGIKFKYRGDDDDE